jgi:hypothetical protein
MRVAAPDTVVMVTPKTLVRGEMLMKRVLRPCTDVKARKVGAKRVMAVNPAVRKALRLPVMQVLIPPSA